MSIVNTTIIDDATQGSTRIVVVDFDIHTGETIRKRVSFDKSITLASLNSTYRAEVLSQMAVSEVSEGLRKIYKGIVPDIVAEHQPQARYDRRILAELMTDSNLNHLLVGYQFLMAVKVRGGGTLNSVASYLGVPSAKLLELFNRLSAVNDISSFLLSDKSNVWDSVPVEFE